MVLELGKFVGAEGGGPDAAEVVLRASQVDGEGVVEEADGGEGLSRPSIAREVGSKI
ncbi:hypothetical protein [Streptomyces halstedii]|uniref:hypothetical protein n=1 Tax=Streptomyces halstedii TaxID=1944 RepID=UPI003349564B